MWAADLILENPSHGKSEGRGDVNYTKALMKPYFMIVFSQEK
jgi:hypothetical protein